MSYCRLSDDCYQSDIYCYESEDGFVINVAEVRFVFSEKPPETPDELLSLPIEEIRKYLDKVDKLVKSARKEKIGLPFDGETFVLDDQRETIDMLVTLRETGYRVPKMAIVRLLQEISAEGCCASDDIKCSHN